MERGRLGWMLAQEDIEDVIYAARTGDLEDLQALFAKLHLASKDLLACVDNGNTPLHMAGANGLHACVLFLVHQLQPLGEAGVQFVNTQNGSGNTALHWACLNGHLDVVKTLVSDARADPFLNNAAGLDALYEAEANDKKEVVEWLLANVDYSQSLGEEAGAADGLADGQQD